MRCSLLFFFLNVFVIQAQKDSVRLVDIQSSECGGTYHVEPHFLSRKTIGDTTYISLACSNNCAGFNNPKVTLTGDSVKIEIGYGLKTISYLLRSGLYIDSTDLNNYPKDSILEEITESLPCVIAVIPLN